MAGSTKAAAQPQTAETPPREAMSLQEKFVKLREAVSAPSQRQHSEGVNYKFAKIYDVYECLTPAMNQYGVNFDIVTEKATRHAENGDPVYYSHFQKNTQEGVWVYEADLTLRWTNADDPEDILEVTLHAIGTNDCGPDKAKGSAWTYCLRYYLFEKFGIDQGGEDPDLNDRSNTVPPPAPNRPTAPENAVGDSSPARQPGNTQNGHTGAQRLLTDAQLSRMYRKGEDARISQAQIDEEINRQYGHKDPRNLTRAQYDEICNQLDVARKQQGQGGAKDYDGSSPT